MWEVLKQVISAVAKLFLGLFVKSPVTPEPVPVPPPAPVPTPAPPPAPFVPPPPILPKDALGFTILPGTGNLAALDAFVAKYNGHYVDFDKVYGYQCVDLVNQYITEVLHRSALPGNAINFFGEGALWGWVRNNINDLKQIPPKGSIVVFHQGGGIPVEGHNSIILSADSYHFNSFDQNWPVGHAVGVVRHDYTYVVGFGVPLDRMGRSVLS